MEIPKEEAEKMAEDFFNSQAYKELKERNKIEEDKLWQDTIIFGQSIQKVDMNGKVERIDPLSEEAEKIWKSIREKDASTD